MRYNHQPFFIKQLINRCTDFYIKRFIIPQFEAVASAPMIVAPQHLQLFGHQLYLGRSAHIISAKHNPIELTTWQSKQVNGRIDIGDYCLISPGVRIASAQNIRIGDNCMIAANAYISDSDWHGLYNRLRPFRCSKPISIDNNVWIGDSAIIGKGVHIGENSVIGAGSVVTHSIPANTVAAGNPAKVIKTLNPNRRMLKREYLFRQHTATEQSTTGYRAQQEALDAYACRNNSLLGWLKQLLGFQSRP